MTEAETMQRVQEISALLGQADLPDTVADDIVLIMPGPDDLPWAGTYRGKQAVAAWYAAVEQWVSTQVLDVRGYIVQGNQVAIRFHEEAIVRPTLHPKGA